MSLPRQARSQMSGSPWINKLIDVWTSFVARLMTSRLIGTRPNKAGRGRRACSPPRGPTVAAHRHGDQKMPQCFDQPRPPCTVPARAQIPAPPDPSGQRGALLPPRPVRIAAPADRHRTQAPSPDRAFAGCGHDARRRDGCRRHRWQHERFAPHGGRARPPRAARPVPASRAPPWWL
jgi:hypothetical protein